MPSKPSPPPDPPGSGEGTSTDYYDADGNLLAETGPEGNAYGPDNPGGCDPLTKSNCSYTTYYTYDGAGRLTETTNPDGHSTTDYYDASGDLIAVTGASGEPGSCDPATTPDCADTAYYAYNGAGQKTGVSYSDGTPSVSYAYSSATGPACWMYEGTASSSCGSPPPGSDTYSYNSLGLMSSETSAAGTTVTYAYDALTAGIPVKSVGTIILQEGRGWLQRHEVPYEKWAWEPCS